jgi:hypothetical protein
MASPSKTLYIIYNATGTIMGKLSYGYKKINCPKDADPICAACEITHGGLSLKETPGWVAAKSEIEAEGIKVVCNEGTGLHNLLMNTNIRNLAQRLGEKRRR